MKSSKVWARWALGLITVVSLVSMVLLPVTAVSVNADEEDLARQKAEVMLMHTPANMHAAGSAELSLRTDRFGHKELEVEATARGLAAGRVFTLCVNGMSFGHGHFFLGVTSFEGEHASSLSSLHGVNVAIKRGFNCAGITVLRGMVP